MRIGLGKGEENIIDGKTTFAVRGNSFSAGLGKKGILYIKNSILKKLNI